MTPILPEIPSVPRASATTCHWLYFYWTLSSSTTCRFPNNFWGWGGEDDELGHRLELQVRSMAPLAVPRFMLLVGVSTRLLLIVPVVGAVRCKCSTGTLRCTTPGSVLIMQGFSPPRRPPPALTGSITDVEDQLIQERGRTPSLLHSLLHPSAPFTANHGPHFPSLVCVPRWQVANEPARAGLASGRTCGKQKCAWWVPSPEPRACESSSTPPCRSPVCSCFAVAPSHRPFRRPDHVPLRCRRPASAESERHSRIC